MPLHLLGKKSWNVYNADNIARVRRDEAAAKAAEEAEEQRMQEVDAQRRLALLRGEVPPPIEDVEPPKAGEEEAHSPARRDGSDGFRRKRKRPGEDDTDFELRVARETTERSLTATTTLESGRKPTSTAPIVDHAGHIDLLGDEKLRAHAEKNEEAEKEAKKKKQSFEDQYTMRFANAAGKDGLKGPWYSQSDATVQAPQALRDAFGNDDPKRKERDVQRIVSNDPLAMMRQGASRVRELKQERKRFATEREQEMREMRRDERHEEKRRRRREGEERERERERGDSSRHSRHRRRSRSRERGHDRHSESRSERRRHGDDHERIERGRGDRHHEKRSRDESRRLRRDSRSPRRDGGRDRERQ